MGHLVAAKVFGMRVEKYSIGFPPKIFGVTWGETEYSIGAIPLGGFVKISGMIDESLDTEKMKAEPEPWEFRSKPAWQRLIVMMGGIIVNVILGIFIFIMMTFFLGETFISKDEMNKHGVVAYEYGEQLGFQTGDKIMKVNGQDFERFSDVTSIDVLLGENSYYTIDRGGEIVEIKVPGDFIETLSDKEALQNFILPRSKFTVGLVEKGMGADLAGFQEGDQLTAINGKEIYYYHEIWTYMKDTLQSHKGENVQVQMVRDGQTLTKDVLVSDDGRLGYQPVRDTEFSNPGIYVLSIGASRNR